MKKLFPVILLPMCLALQPARAQFSISTTRPMEMSGSPDSVRNKSTKSYEYFSKARNQAERRRIRKERNTVEFNTTLQASQTSFDNWSAGGQNTFSARSTIFFSHKYQREKIALESKFESRIGMNIIDDKPFKNEDEFKLSSTGLIPLYGELSYSGALYLRSQWANGYATRKDTKKKSAFMSPGFFDASLGVNYRPKAAPYLSITLNPISTNLTTAVDEELSRQGLGGVTPGEHVKGQIGPSIRIDFDKEFVKKVFRLRSGFYTFTDFKVTPRVRWETNLDIRATKYLTTTLFGVIYYDKLSSAPAPNQVQWNFVISVGLSYRFKNK